MTEKTTVFHTKRRAFIIMPDVGLLVAQKKFDVSHKQMLENMGLSTTSVLNFLTKHAFILVLLLEKLAMFGKK